MDKPIIELNDVKIGFGKAGQIRKAVDGVSFALYPGKTYALLGESGCGKSLTGLAMMQLLPNNAVIIGDGQIKLHGQDIFDLSEVAMRSIRGKRIAMIFQEPMTSLNPVLTIGQQIKEVVRLHKTSEQKATVKVLELLDAVGIPDVEKRIGEYPHQLSGGMKQRVMIAMALAGEPEVLIADEPTTALDVTIQAQVLKLMQDIQQRTQMAILFITHDMGVAATMADTVGIMYAGHLVEQADKQGFFHNAKHPYSQKLLAALPNMDKRNESLSIIPGIVPALTEDFKACRFASRCPYKQSACEQAAPKWLGDNQHFIRCHQYDKHYQNLQWQAKEEESKQSINTTKATDEMILQASKVKVHFPIRKGFFKRVVGHVKAVDGVDLTLYKGKTLALVGESGCGKTTVGKSIIRLLDLTDGQVNYQEIDIHKLKRSKEKLLRKDIQFIFQDPFSAMNPRMMVGDIIAEGLDSNKLVSNKLQRDAKIDELLQAVGLPADSKSRYPHEFSGGQRQRICIARALAVDPKVIICDEPTSALDVSVQAQVLNLLKDLQQKYQLTYLFITHNISVVAYLADDVAVMYLGRIVEQGSVNEVLQQAKHPYTQALLKAVPKIDEQSGQIKLQLSGELPSPINPPIGCHFHPRCPNAMEKCKKSYPEDNKSEHMVKCFLYS